MKYVVLPLQVWQSVGRRTVPKMSYRVVNYDAGLNERKYPKETVAWSDNADVAGRIADMLNGNPALSVTATWAGKTAQEWKESYQSLFDSIGKIIARAERAEAERDALRNVPTRTFGTPDERISDHEQLRRLTHRVWKLEQSR